MIEVRSNTQMAPWPDELIDIVGKLTLPTRPGWRFWIGHEDRGQGSQGLTLTVLVVGPDSYHPEREVRVGHLFPVPPASYDRRSWQRWVFDRLRDVDIHKLCEGFTVEGVKPYAPSHGPGNDPYLIREIGTDVDRRTSFRGELK